MRSNVYYSHQSRLFVKINGPSFLILFIGSFLFFVILSGLWNIIEGAKVSISAILSFLALILLDSWLLFFALYFYQPFMELYSDEFKRTGLPRFLRRKIRYKDIKRIIRINDKNKRVGLAFILMDNFRFIIPLDSIDPELYREFLNRLHNYGIKVQQTLQIEYFPDFFTLPENASNNNQ